ARRKEQEGQGAPMAEADEEGTEQEDEQSPGEKLWEQAQAVVDKFLKLNRWNGVVDPQSLTICGSRERDLYQTVVGDGEAFVRFHPSDRGLEVRFIDATQIRDHMTDFVNGLSFGIRHRMEPYEDVETPVEYVVFWQDMAAKGGVEGERQE